MAQLDVLESLGERVVKAARLAAAMHFEELVGPKDGAERMLRGQAGIGGAGLELVNDSHRSVPVMDDRWR